MNEALQLGVFTQDLAQELDPKAKAVDLVTAYARRDDIYAASDLDARNVMGQLGLSGDKATREIEGLSGGEKARVALSMFCMRASNLLLLDEPSNHLDVECIEALSESLSEWGEEDGAVVVISHDQSFCKKIGFTHVGTVADGKLVVQQRSTRASDWKLFDGLSATIDMHEEEEAPPVEDVEKKEIDRQKQKQAFNAPKRIAKIESQIEAAEEKMAELDKEMLENGHDVGLLVDLSEKRQVHEANVMELMEEWEELEELMASLA